MPEPLPHQESVYAALLNAAAGVFTTTLTLLVGWLHDRGADARRASATKQLLDRVQLLGAWYLTRTWVSPEDVESSRALVKQELDLAMEAVKRLRVSAVEPGSAARSNQAAAKYSWFRRWFLLYMPSTFFAWLPRLFFYFCLWMVVSELYNLFTAVLFGPWVVLREMFRLQRRQVRICNMLQVGPGVLCCSFFALLDIVNRFGGRKPTLRVDVVHGHLYALSVVL